ncbi:SAM-dependent methyltransferase [Nocardia panacis]|nr:methyltransferase domain-containing protein [Nocardia panacis]
MAETPAADYHSEAVGEYYDEVGAFVELVGGNLHLGYWEDDRDNTPFPIAMTRLTTMVGERLALAPGQRLLDVGCGVATPAITLARRFGVAVTGITISGGEVAAATHEVAEAGLAEQISIQLADAAAMPFAPARFDAALAFDSFPTAPDKRQWCTEIFRTVRPGGRFVYSDYPLSTAATPAEREMLRANTVAHPPGDMAAATAPAEAAGFTVTETLDLGERVRPYYTEFLKRLGAQRDTLADRYGSERVDAFVAGITPMYEFCREKLGYYLIVCRKPD